MHKSNKTTSFQLQNLTLPYETLINSSIQPLLSLESTMKGKPSHIKMHFAIIASAGLYAMLANAQVGQNTASGTESFTPFQSTQATCLNQCHIADVGCRSKCIYVSTCC